MTGKLDCHEQEPYESYRLWRNLTRALLAKDMDAVTTAAKGAVENAPCELRAAGAKHATRFEFRDNCWVPRIHCAATSLHCIRIVPFCRLPEDMQEATAAVQAWMWSGLPEGAPTMTTTGH